MKAFDVIDFQKNEAQNLRLQNLASDISSPVNGLIYYSTAGVDHIRAYIDGAWEDIPRMSDVTASGISATLVDAKGDLIVATGADAVDNLPVGVNGTILVAASGQSMGMEWRTLVDGDIPAGIARDSEVTTAVSNHAALAVLDGDAAGGVLSGTYPNPGFAVDMATQAELDTQVSALTAAITANSEGKFWKDPVRAATTAAGTLASSFENGDTIDGVVLATGDRILIKNQASGAENGIYVVNASGAPTRAADMSTADEADNATVLIEDGTVNKGDVYTQTADIVTIGTTAMTWVKSSEGNTVYTADEVTLTLSGTQFALKSGGLTGLIVAADVNGTGVVSGGGTVRVSRTFEDTIAGGSTSEVITHGLGTRAVHVSLINPSSPWDHVMITAESTSTSTVTIRAANNLPAGYIVVVTG